MNRNDCNKKRHANKKLRIRVKKHRAINEIKKTLEENSTADNGELF